ncbi:hypothetical protein HYH03_012087 [Edaphochlamys debaryana]|uniref:Alkyl transferase n=1 Tax=Edaphochlamys debaryana TaxID=47281 RepID=A0A835XST8_9CHLO|nr:hypothetical protein HYH03_012087 [Edaphochlamys debaryana]|eukprot:KAG2489451.1 hypothetical protein HYH03_012087 [Edaphochlamys debaryana]
MDGNFRWGQRRGGDWRQGHQAGAQALKRVVRWAQEDGVKALTVYAFSAENWSRPPEEVGFLMRLLEGQLNSELDELAARGVRVTFAGERAGLPESLRRTMARAEAATAHNTGLVLCVCISYGGRQDITRAARELCRQVSEGRLRPEEVTEQRLAEQLSTRTPGPGPGPGGPGVGDPDLLIRTSGERRLSNFMLWECAYAELYFTDVSWPDFDRAEWQAALRHYRSRQRSFGGRSAPRSLGALHGGGGGSNGSGSGSGGKGGGGDGSLAP